jgi:hypothetical protein
MEKPLPVTKSLLGWVLKPGKAHDDDDENM